MNRIKCILYLHLRQSMLLLYIINGYTFCSLQQKKMTIKIPHFIWCYFWKINSRWRKKMFRCEFYWPFLTRGAPFPRSQQMKKKKIQHPPSVAARTIAIWETAMRKMRNDHRMKTKCLNSRAHSFYFILFYSRFFLGWAKNCSKYYSSNRKHR